MPPMQEHFVGEPGPIGLGAAPPNGTFDRPADEVNLVLAALSGHDCSKLGT